MTFNFAPEYAVVDGEPCAVGLVPSTIYWAIDRSTDWPWSGAPPCNRTGVPAKICLDPHRTACSAEFFYEGEDVFVELDYADYYPVLLDYPALTVKFGHNGIPQPVTLVSAYVPFGQIASCVNMESGSLDAPPARVASFVLVWSTFTREGCHAIGLDFEATFLTEEFGELSGAFTWLGEDVTLNIDTGSLLETPTPLQTPSPSPTVATVTDGPPSASPTPTPAALPDTGGEPGAQPPGRWPWLLTGAGVMLAAACWWAARRRAVRPDIVSNHLQYH